MSALQILTTNEGKRIYGDQGTGAHRDLTVFQPEIPEGFFMVGHYGQPNYQNVTCRAKTNLVHTSTFAATVVHKIF